MRMGKVLKISFMIPVMQAGARALSGEWVGYGYDVYRAPTTTTPGYSVVVQPEVDVADTTIRRVVETVEEVTRVTTEKMKGTTTVAPVTERPLENEPVVLWPEDGEARVPDTKDKKEMDVTDEIMVDPADTSEKADEDAFHILMWREVKNQVKKVSSQFSKFSLLLRGNIIV